MKFKAGEIKEFETEYKPNDYNLVQYVGMENKFNPPVPVLVFKVITGTSEAPALSKADFIVNPMNKKGEVKTQFLNEFYEALGFAPLEEGQDFDIPEDPTVDSGFLKPIYIYIEKPKDSDFGRIPAFIKGGKVFLSDKEDTKIQNKPPVRDDSKPGF